MKPQPGRGIARVVSSALKGVSTRQAPFMQVKYYVILVCPVTDGNVFA